MDNSIYVALSRQMNVFRNMETTANNLANVNTPGYQSEHVMFTDFLVNEGDNRNKLAFVQDLASWRNTQTGRMQITGNPLDMAIGGPGYFMVQTPQGRQYTRAGNFTLGSDGTLMTAQGYPVLNDGGQPVAFDGSVRQIRVGANGTITATNNEGTTDELGVLALVEFEDPQSMLRTGDQLFQTSQTATPATASSVTQGAVEMSNVNAVTELVKVTELSRSTNNSAKFIEAAYDLERKTSNAYARSNNG